ncbi:MAG: PQQ-binding-like beta-propeller repeat protein [Phycisphaeraceae bacterium]|nr:PQQ-binding-like beta-propeller repeat protein [Phycisphaeraceae bacterium]
MKRLGSMLLLATALSSTAPPSRGDHHGPEKAPKDPLKATLPLRTALHRNPTLKAPFDRMIKIYRQSGSVDPLIRLYRNHLNQYPNDANAQIVLLRILIATRDLKAEPEATRATQRFANNPTLHHLRHRALLASDASEALEALDRAVRLQKRPKINRRWTLQLLKLAEAQGRRKLIGDHLDRLEKLAGRQPAALLEVGRLMLDHRLPDPAHKAFEKAISHRPGPQLLIDLELSASRAEIDMGLREQAAARLEKLLNKLTVDHWRRGEVLRRRLGLVDSESKRQAMIDRARQTLKQRGDETAVIDLAQTLMSFDRRREALEELLRWESKLPTSKAIEETTLSLFDRLRDDRGKQDYLSRRIERFPTRNDLLQMHVKSLFRTGQTTEAHAAFEKLFERLEPAKRPAVLMAMGRFLRTAGQMRPAIKMFERVVKLEPHRLDLRRELAELYVAAGRSTAAGRLLRSSIPEDAPLETVLDAVQFMVQRRMYREARQALKTRLPQAPTNMDLRLSLIDIEAKLGHLKDGQTLIDQTRSMADTTGRYRAWLTSATQFHDAYDQAASFLEDERQKLASHDGDWNPKHVQRLLAFAEIASKAGVQKSVKQMLIGRLQSDPPAAVRIQLRRQIVRLLSNEMVPPPLLQQQLQALIQEDPASANQYHARLAVLYGRARRPDLARPLLKKLEVDRLKDPKLLSSIQPLIISMGDSEKILSLLRRLTEVDTANRDHWERWIYALAASGRESELRRQLRKLLAGVRQMELDQPTQRMLKAQLFDSHWRSMVKRLNEGSDGSLNAALGELDRIEEAATSSRQWLWVTWTRAYLLNRLGRHKARDEALAELDGKNRSGDGQGTPAPTVLPFPDGLRLSMKQAKQLASAPAQNDKPRWTRPIGPRAPITLKWVFQTGGSHVMDMIPAGKGVLIRDHTGRLWMVDRDTGRLLWQKQTGAAHPLARPRGRHGRLIVPGTHAVQCLSLENGKVLWEARPARSARSATAGASASPSHRHGHVHLIQGRRVHSRLVSTQTQATAASGTPVAPICCFVHEGNILAYEPIGGTLSTYDRRTGKLLREKQLSSAIQTAGPSAGACLSNGNLFVYGKGAGLIDTQTGKFLWWFDPQQAHTWPVSLNEPAPPGTPASQSVLVPAQPTGSWGALHARKQILHINYLQQAADQQHLQSLSGPVLQPMRLVPTLALWAAASSRTDRVGIAGASRLLLFDSREGSAHLINARLPLGAKRLSLSGSVVGQNQHHVYLLQDRSVTSVDLTTGRLRTVRIPLDDEQNQDFLIRAVLDGPLLWACSMRRLICLNAHTRQVLLNQELPEAAVSPTPLFSTTRRHMPGGLVVLDPQTGRPAWQSPVHGASDRGVFYLTTASDRVVALQQREADDD